MKRQYKKTAKYLKSSLTRLEHLTRDRDLPGLHRLAVDLKTSLPESVSYENSVLLLDGLRVNHEADIEAYAARLGAKLRQLIEEYREKAGG